MHDAIDDDVIGQQVVAQRGGHHIFGVPAQIRAMPRQRRVKAVDMAGSLTVAQPDRGRRTRIVQPDHHVLLMGTKQQAMGGAQL